jgi:ribonuclease D
MRDKRIGLRYSAFMRVITQTSDLQAACEVFAKADFVTVDTEFMRETTFWPVLCLIQMAGPEAEVVVDPMAPGLDLAPFHALMRNDKVVKVFHAARQDIEIVYAQIKAVPTPVFDTQIAAMVCGFGESVSYVNLVKKVTGVDLDKSSRFTDWSRRPLTEGQLTYALADVTHLRDVYHYLQAELAATGRAGWVGEEISELTAVSTYQTDPEMAWKRLKMRVKSRKALGVLIELAAWRERAAQAQNVPRGRILRDEALYDVANQCPTTAEKLGELRTLSDGFSRSGRAREILDAVNRGLARDPKTLPAIDGGTALTPEATATVELLRVLLKAAAARHRVAPRLIADAEDLELIASKGMPDVRALKGWRYEIFGADAVRLKRGELALGLEKGEVVAITKQPTSLDAAVVV